MYYIANAVLFSLGYKLGDRISHNVTSDALIFFVMDILEDFETAKNEVLEI
jgi:hypothetical protein